MTGFFRKVWNARFAGFNVPVLLVGVLYFVWRQDLVSDTTVLGFVDDALVLVMVWLFGRGSASRPSLGRR